jgi:hypothetical protein
MLTETLMLFCFLFSFSFFLFCLPVYLVEDNCVLVDDSGGLLCEFGWGPAEFFAETEVGDGGVGFLAADGADKKSVSSLESAQRPFTIWEKSSPNAIGTPFSSLRSLSSDTGFVSGCCLRAAQIVSACMAMKSLACTCPERGWYFVCFCIMRLRLAQVISLKV